MELFERIRRDHREEWLSVRALARRHRVHRRTVRQALASALPPPRAVPLRASPVIGLDEPLAAANRADGRRHVDGRRESVAQAFEQERPHLRPLPAHLAGRQVPARLGARSVEVLDEGRVVARHERSHVKGSQTLLLDTTSRSSRSSPG